MNPQRVVITIDSLSFSGLGARDGHRVGQALQLELTRLVQERGMPSGIQVGCDIPVLQLAPLSSAMRRAPESLGRALASSIYDSMDRPPEVAP